MIFGINTTGDISKIVVRNYNRNLKFETILNITSGIFMPNITYKSCYYLFTTTRKRFVIFTCRYFKLG